MKRHSQPGILTKPVRVRRSVQWFSQKRQLLGSGTLVGEGCFQTELVSDLVSTEDDAPFVLAFALLELRVLFYAQIEEEGEVCVSTPVSLFLSWASFLTS